MGRPNNHPTNKRARSVNRDPWSPDDDAVLRECYPNSPKGDLIGLFPGRTYKAIGNRARAIGVLRFTTAGRCHSAKTHSFLLRLRERRIAIMKPCKLLAYEVGVHEWTIYNWENGTSTPTFPHLCKCLDALGCEIDFKTRRDFRIVTRAANVGHIDQDKTRAKLMAGRA